MAVITISRQYGSGGDEIAARLCEVLGYRFFDKRLMAQVATEAGLSLSEMVDFSEDNYKLQNFFERLFGRRSSRVVIPANAEIEGAGSSRSDVFIPGLGLLPYEVPNRLAFNEVEEQPEETRSITLIQSIVQAAYKHGNVVIVGRGGQAILKDKPDVLHVRIVASLDARAQRLHEQANFSLGGAQDSAIQHDRASAEYLKRFYDVDWTDPILYDLVINTTKLGLEGATQLIVDAVSRLPAAKPA
ncbi:MAG: cytidylate kinase-like family protein [Anaerolineales bacterium]|nr:cytidylate kinase-like family protein [Anaerolineales bacterium]